MGIFRAEDKFGFGVVEGGRKSEGLRAGFVFKESFVEPCCGSEEKS
jgi:hypothetical protein